MGLLATFQFHFIFPRVEVSQEHIFSFQSNERVRAVSSVVVRILFYCYGKIDFCVSLMPPILPLVFSVDLALFCVFFIEFKSKCLPFSLSFDSALVLWSALVLKRPSLSSDSLSYGSYFSCLLRILFVVECISWDFCLRRQSALRWSVLHRQGLPLRDPCSREQVRRVLRRSVFPV
jgi:hypothetical protein